MAKKSQSWWREFTKEECTRLLKSRKYRAECKIEQKHAAYWLSKKTENREMISKPAKPKSGEGRKDLRDCRARQMQDFEDGQKRCRDLS